MASETAASESSDLKPYVRVATHEDIPQIVEIMSGAFAEDPLFLYCNIVQELLPTGGMPEADAQRLRTVFTFLVTNSLSLGSRVTLAIDPSKKSAVDGREQVCCAAIWEPPNVRMEVGISTIGTFLKNGFWKVFRTFGFKRFCRLVFENADVAHKEASKALKKKGIKRKNYENYWHLMFMMTHPDFQGKGYMSKVMREGFAHAPDAIFGLESTTAKSKAQYAHLGYELQSSFFLGKGKVDSAGLPKQGEEAKGVEIYTMFKFPSPPSDKQ